MTSSTVLNGARRGAPSDRRDLWFLWALVAHAPVAAGLGFLLSRQETWWHITGEAVAPAIVAALAYQVFGGQRLFRLIGAVLLMLYSGAIIHLGGGLIEWHFHVFVSLALLILYYDWAPIVVAAATVAIHHIILDEVLPTAVFKDGQSHGIVLLHATFVVIQTTGCVFLAERLRRSAASVQRALSVLAYESAPLIEGGLGALASGDLTVAAEIPTVDVPDYGRDEIGQMHETANAMARSFQAIVEQYERARSGLRELVQEVQATSVSLAATSEQVGSAASETATVVHQVNQAMQSVASGAQVTSRSAQEGQDAAGRFSQAIATIVKGAAEQAAQVQAASATASQMSEAVEQVASDANEVAATSQQTKEAAEQSARAVRETVTGMAEIQRVVSDAADKVQELGRLGEKIGQVVETIDDIAEQTNLLALNAAIEAARAGEHGRGFAVVADEVRKLAERSSRETKQIAELIQQVQAGTRHAVEAMGSGARKVDEQASRADEAGHALESIQTAIDTTVGQVSGIASAAQDLAGSSHTVVQAMQAIRAVVEANTSSTGEMTSQAEQVNHAIEGIAAVAEEQSAATEEVSASSEEMSAHVEEMSAQAQELATAAQHLEELVSRFKLDVPVVEDLESEALAQPEAESEAHADEPDELLPLAA
jgi:methyl-accepting chemotaxis protein